MKYEKIDEKTRSMVNQFLIDHWYTTKMVVRGQQYDLATVDGVIALNEYEDTPFQVSDMKGLVTYMIRDDICEIMSLDSIEESHGIGTELVRQVIEIAKKAHCSKITLITTNDNINAIRFYQKRGFDMARLYHNALDVSRKMKPEIPLIGDNGIPLKHEIEFEMELK